jgi:hypothetical protein
LAEQQPPVDAAPVAQAPAPASAQPDARPAAASVASGAVAPTSAATATATAAAAFFGDYVDDEARRAEALKEERRQRLRALQLDLEADKRGDPPPAAAAASTARMAQPQQRPAEEEEDPLDAFMKTQVLEQAKKEAERAAAHQVAWRAQYGHKDVQITDAIEPDNDPNKHCYVCKKWGHTKKDCPNKRCRFCGQEGHFSEECEEKDRKIGAQFDKDKERKRQKAYAAKKAKKRAEWESQLRAKTGIEGYEVSAPDWVGLE